ncbi:hypothetical protein C9374_001852 [Naegleria lovaniensis]|uniref:Uncharacterized protein n=1 Tax=Naegleria lovaniensis TaxID=51637 RepID=A0AA88KQW1_NAELO|nr:uncharacterized protein C9374_001852 [Naegleria lovaniensis]KAG2386817.1 hypothetical protein C9374_001852 [Naegleria lovaniensis]
MNSSLMSSVSRLHHSSAASPSSSMISESSTIHDGDESGMFFKKRMSSSILNSSVSSQASTASRWEEMNYLAKEIHDNAVRKGGSSKERSKRNYEDNLRPNNSCSRDSSTVFPSSSRNKEHVLSDTLDSASSILQKYIDKYNCRATTGHMDLDDSLTDLYSRLSDGFPNTTSTPVSIKNTPNYLLDSSISSVAPLKTASANPMDDLLSICSRSTITTNSDELFSKLDHYSKKYNEKKKESVSSVEVKSKKSLLTSDSIFDSDKENFISNKSSKTKKKSSTTPTKRPQSVKVSTLRESSSETNKKRSKTPSKSSTSQTSQRVTSTTTTSSSTNKYTSATRKPPVPKFPKSSTLSTTNHTKKSTKNSPPSTIKSSTRCDDISDISSLSEDEEKMESKSCQTSMIQTGVDTIERPSSANTMTTLASISSSIHSSSSPLIGSTNEIAFKIVGSTENIEKVEVYLKNSQKQSYLCSSNASVTSEKLDPASDSSFTLNASEEDVSNTLKPLKSLYSKYFTQ